MYLPLFHCFYGIGIIILNVQMSKPRPKEGKQRAHVHTMFMEEPSQLRSDFLACWSLCIRKGKWTIFFPLTFKGASPPFQKPEMKSQTQMGGCVCGSKTVDNISVKKDVTRVMVTRSLNLGPLKLLLKKVAESNSLTKVISAKCLCGDICLAQEARVL